LAHLEVGDARPELNMVVLLLTDSVVVVVVGRFAVLGVLSSMLVVELTN
jgi:hypothetical protein